ncbi:Uncharacterised protein [Legionella busanensis]|uniref:Uncharacterized protein n=1 Tax=Legionella busanensis TaxID=190655 RepID=A0A378JJZ8_9GAMM|nr:hypothetical protein [Legionella busanensis]STX50643.1 Uncharacterised protein [Legionella busanensis]
MPRTKVDSDHTLNIKHLKKEKNVIPSVKSPVIWPTKGVKGEYHKPTNIAGVPGGLSYIMIDENSTLLMAGHAGRDNNNPLFLQDVESVTPASNINSNSNPPCSSVANSLTTPETAASNPDPFTHAYIVYPGILTQNGVDKRVQVIFMAQPSKTRVANGDHSRLNSSVKAIINRGQLALAPGEIGKEITSKYESPEGEKTTVVWRITPDKCLFGTNVLSLDTKNGHRFCGECKSALTDENVKERLGKTLEDGITFNTKGTATESFKDLHPSQVEFKTFLESFISGKCMEFTEVRPPHVSNNCKIDDKLVHTIRTPGRWQACVKQSISEVKEHPVINPNEKRPNLFFRQSTKPLKIVEVNIPEEDNFDEDASQSNNFG